MTLLNLNIKSTNYLNKNKIQNIDKVTFLMIAYLTKINGK